jgi:hypothetical protein
MNTPGVLLGAGFFLALLAGCADHRVDRSDDAAMMVYRDCMTGAPPQLNSADMNTTVSSSKLADQNTSIAARAQTQQEQAQQTRCMQLAGWEQD